MSTSQAASVAVSAPADTPVCAAAARQRRQNSGASHTRKSSGTRQVAVAQRDALLQRQHGAHLPEEEDAAAAEGQQRPLRRRVGCGGGRSMRNQAQAAVPASGAWLRDQPRVRGRRRRVHATRRGGGAGAGATSAAVVALTQAELAVFIRPRAPSGRVRVCRSLCACRGSSRSAARRAALRVRAARRSATHAESRAGVTAPHRVVGSHGACRPSRAACSGSPRSPRKVVDSTPASAPAGVQQQPWRALSRCVPRAEPCLRPARRRAPPFPRRPRVRGRNGN